MVLAYSSKYNRSCVSLVGSTVRFGHINSNHHIMTKQYISNDRRLHLMNIDERDV